MLTRTLSVTLALLGASPAFGQDLIGEWVFTDTTLGDLPSSWTGGIVYDIPAETGAGLFTVVIDEDSFAIPTTLNSPLPTLDDGTNSITLDHPPGSGSSSIVLTVATPPDEDLTFSLDVTGPDNRTWSVSYSTDYGTTFNPMGSFLPPGSGWDSIEFDMSSYDDAEGVPDLLIFLTLDNTGLAHTVSFDNVRVTAKPLCFADCDSSCVLNVDDVDCFIAAYLAADLAADCDANGSLNIDDIDCFIAAFTDGC